MINIFLNGWLHHKNLLALQKYSNINIITDINDIEKCDVIYSPSNYMNSQEYPNKIYIYGPHCSVMPTYDFINILNKKNNMYIIPSQWCKDFWVNMTNSNAANFIKVLPFGVDTNKFNEITSISNRENVFVYYKSRHPDDLNYLEKFLKYKNINYKLFSYNNKYDENDFIEYLQNSKYGIILDAHESQGFAIEEALSCNVPLLVWNVNNMNQEYNQNYPNIPATSIPYWDNRCGEYFYKNSELEETFNKFISKLKTYKPREYILENLSLEKCEEKLLNLILNHTK